MLLAPGRRHRFRSRTSSKQIDRARHSAGPPAVQDLRRACIANGYESSERLRVPGFLKNCSTHYPCWRPFGRDRKFSGTDRGARASYLWDVEVERTMTRLDQSDWEKLLELVGALYSAEE